MFPRAPEGGRVSARWCQEGVTTEPEDMVGALGLFRWGRSGWPVRDEESFMICALTVDKIGTQGVQIQ